MARPVAGLRQQAPRLFRIEDRTVQAGVAAGAVRHDVGARHLPGAQHVLHERLAIHGQRERAAHARIVERRSLDVEPVEIRGEHRRAREIRIVLQVVHELRRQRHLAERIELARLVQVQRRVRALHHEHAHAPELDVRCVPVTRVLLNSMYCRNFHSAIVYGPFETMFSARVHKSVFLPARASRSSTCRGTGIAV